MEDQNKENVEQEETEKIQSPEADARDTTGTMTEFISTMNYVLDKLFRAIPEEEMETKYKDDVFWYVYNDAAEGILAHQTNKVDEPAVYLFQEREDAEYWMEIGRQSGTHQDSKLSVKSDKYRTLLESNENTGEFRLLGISHAEAQNLFANYPTVAVTLEARERRKLNPDSEGD
jgi:hypothetical protein